MDCSAISVRSSRFSILSKKDELTTYDHLHFAVTILELDWICIISTVFWTASIRHDNIFNAECFMRVFIPSTLELDTVPPQCTLPEKAGCFLRHDIVILLFCLGQGFIPCSQKLHQISTFFKTQILEFVTNITFTNAFMCIQHFVESFLPGSGGSNNKCALHKERLSLLMNELINLCLTHQI